jgi:hypothetical protein
MRCDRIDVLWRTVTNKVDIAKSPARAVKLDFNGMIWTVATLHLPGEWKER